ncbi:auxin-induced protein 22D-like [Andrographis paniculata]|uniref:auxin-induced protein 22D-like n=1 Tax=Andrographis paniculata TaxID=175694 RepID=UPI0021E84A8F|nr:auxin-induced protein 22D-like [Andrographis paniculata]
MTDLNLKATELRLGLPGTDAADDVTPPVSNKRASPELSADERATKATPKAQIVGWPPVRSTMRKNSGQKKSEADQQQAGMFVKVSMDGAPYLRKIDLKVYKGYSELLEALEGMFKLPKGEYSEREGYKGSEYAPAYEDKDGDLMLVGDVPWEMFVSTCKRLRIVKGQEAARGLLSCAFS